MTDQSATPLISSTGFQTSTNDSASPVTFAAMAPRRSSDRISPMVVAAGIVDWIIIVAAGVGGYYLGNLTPNMRPFQLEDPDISFPYRHHETVTSGTLVIATVAVPVATILVFSLLTTPGLSVPPGTPAKLVWRRKLWEFYASLQSYAVGMVAQWFIINFVKNLCGKPRPDLISRCQPDLAHLSEYIVGGIANITSNGQLVSASICKNTDSYVLHDGFRSYPSGHSGSSAAGLGHLALYLAYKLGVVFPYAAPPAYDQVGALSAFPDRAAALVSASSRSDPYELTDRRRGPGNSSGEAGRSAKNYGELARDQAVHSVRRSGAAPPVYLLVFVLIPLGGSFFIAASRWFNYRHHGFDILFGYFIGTVTSIVAFRLYQLPMSRGAGWAWGPRSSDKAFWAGVGSQSWALPRQPWSFASGDEEEGGEFASPVGDYRQYSSPERSNLEPRRGAP
ncbi:pap2 domain containing protein [Grosmannia clavigera kw1407]|uniref:Pap2 domain containing protein n=1 Tax=Grosmannia clavigera (strain kw1407 / UAMH 11150) TaxID=655863 RepID=F0XMG5_GROCL|nr:pap2 domain containing protein [Grosmannia clavigera kw1407]EFX01116.1 pap2 domain containing protein [Grosmannia clavigera kw1407]